MTAGEAAGELRRKAAGKAAERLRLTGRRVLVVGAGTQPSDDLDAPSGNGRAIAVLAAREGAAVACADLDGSAATATVALIEGENGRACTIEADAADPDQAAEMVRRAHEALDGLDGLVLNVGIGAGAGLEGTSPDDWDRVLGVNLRAHFLACKYALPLLADDGAIVFLGSVAGLRAGSGSPSYDTSKAGILGLCRHVAREGAPRRIRANVVVPGLIDTPIGRAASGLNPARDRAVARIPLGRQGTAWEIAQAAIFLLSEEASYVTGQPLVVDGGLMTL
jgi:NAD(P)-dependent dehydrogenase (short-subunit alcohol dehydrogenase family)